MNKAFDSVSHQSIVRASHRLRTPPFKLRYISEAYSNCSVQLKIGGKLSHDIPVSRGVRQRDPTSSLFNAVIDMVMAEVDPSIGVTGDINSSVKCNYMAFAEDLILVSSSDIGMKKLLEQVEGSLAKVGLNEYQCSNMLVSDNTVTTTLRKCRGRITPGLSIRILTLRSTNIKLRHS